MNDLNKQKTLVVTTPYFPPYGGGLERYALEISSRLASPDYNYKVIVITSGERCGKDSVERVGDLKVYRLSYKLKVSNTPFSFRWFGKIRKILKNEKPDLINIHMPVPGIGDVANLVSRGIPKIVTYHSGTISKGKSLLGLVSCLYEVVFLKVLLDNAKSIICSSDFIRFGFLKKYEYKSITITPGVNSDVFKPDPSKKTSYPSILFVAGLNKTEQYKGLQTLIDTMVEVKKIIPDIVLNVVGDGDMREEYERRVKDLGLENSIKFFGRLTGDRLVEKYQRNHIFISASSNESFSMVILEAMASGLPAIAINSGSVSQIIDDGQNGFILSCQNKGMIKDKILELINNKKIIESFGIKARNKMINNFNWRSRYEVYDKNISGLLKNEVTILESPVRFYPYIGGVEYAVYYLSKELVKLGYKIKVVCANDPVTQKKVDSINGIEINRLDYLFKIANTNITISLPKFLWNTDFDLIHTHIPTPWVSDWSVYFSKIKNKPSVITIQGDLDKPSILGKIITKIYLITFFRLTLFLVDKIVIVNPDWENTFINTSRIYKKYIKKIEIIPNAVDIEMFRPAEVLPNDKSILFVSVLDEFHRFKGLDYLIKAIPGALKIFPDMRLNIVGDGVLKSEYEYLSKNIGVSENVSFLGSKNQTELVDLYKKTNLFILPSIEIEGFAIVPIEAMSSGVPIIISDANGISKDVSNNLAGIVVPKHDSEKITEAINKIFSDRDLQEVMSKNARLLIERKYSFSSIAEMYSSLFKKLIKKNGK